MKVQFLYKKDTSFFLFNKKYEIDSNGISDMPDDVASSLVGLGGFSIIKDVAPKKEEVEEVAEAIVEKHIEVEDKEYDELSIEELIELAVAGGFDKREYAKIKDDKAKMSSYIKAKLK